MRDPKGPSTWRPMRDYERRQRRRYGDVTWPMPTKKTRREETYFLELDWIVLFIENVIIYKLEEISRLAEYPN